MDNMSKGCDLSALHVNLTKGILAWLPIKSVCRFRSVSKEWNIILSSKEFITNKWVKKAPNRDPDPWLVTVQDQWLVSVQEGTSHNWVGNGWAPVQAFGSCFFVDQTWKETSAVSLSFRQQNPDPEESRDPYLYSQSINYFDGSAAGLLLSTRVRAMDPQLQHLVVCNPLTRTSVELPVLSSEVICNAGIMSDSGDAYKVMVIGKAKQRLPLKVEIYDSIDKSWRIAGQLPQNVNLVGRRLVFCNGYFYCLAIISGRRTVVGYNIGEGTSIFRPLPEGTSIFRPLRGRTDSQYMVPHLITCGPRVLIAAFEVYHMEYSEQLLRVIIWELEKVNSSSSSSWWKEIARMPPSDLERFSRNGLMPPSDLDLERFSRYGERFSRYGSNTNNRNCCRYFVDCIECCVGVGDNICFTVFEQRKVKEILAYSVIENTWSWLPTRPLDTTAIIGDCCEILMAFEPRPDMKVD